MPIRSLATRFVRPASLIVLLALLAACGPARTTTPSIPPTSTPQATATPLVEAAGWGGRIEQSLDGTWQFVRVASLDAALPASGWEGTPVPGTIQGSQYERAWFRRSFTVPAGWQGRRIRLQFGGVKFDSRVLVNGVNVGGCFNGYDAFELDVTDAVNFGATNELAVGVHDWTGVFSPGPEIHFTETAWDNLRAVPQDRVLSPVGGLFTNYGIWDRVTLRAVSPVHVTAVSVRPLLDRDRLEADVTVTNSGGESFRGSLQARLFGWYGAGRDTAGAWRLQGDPVAAFPATEVSLAAGETRTLTLVLEHPPLETWTPFHPNLYILETGFDQPDGDAVRLRIGWRQLTVRDGDFLLNGEKIHMLASSWWPTGEGDSRQLVESQLRGLRAMNAVAFRTHTQPWPEIWYEAADEIGVMMIPEGAVWNDDSSYRIDDTAFWGHYRDHLLAMVAKLGNHPSVVMWSLENEFYGGDAVDGSYAEEQLAALGLAVKAADPTRPILYESDGDPGGAADVIGLHYPNEFPEYRDWPADAYWLEDSRTVVGGGGMFWDGQPFHWDHKKPLYVGEYLWIASGDPSTQTVFVGDDAYRNFADYRTLAKAEAWRLQILAYRQQDVSGQSPWTVIEQGPLDESNPAWVAQRDMYSPLAAFLGQYDTHFYGGETVTRTVDLFNDTMEAQPAVRFRWALLSGTSDLGSGEETLAMPSGSHQERTLQLSMPEVTERTQVTLRLTMEAAGGWSFQQDTPLDVFPRPASWTLPQAPVAIVNPNGTMARAWNDLDVKRLDTVQAWDGNGILILGPHALTEADAAARDFLVARVAAGGRILALEQDESASSVLPVSIGNQGSSMAFLQMPSHPALAGFSPEDFRWWRGDLQVSAGEAMRPALAGALPLVVTGSAMGVDSAPLVEVRQGAGAWLICQLLVAGKLESEPVARQLLQQMLDYLGSFEPAGGSVLLADESGQAAGAALALQPDWQPFVGNWSGLTSPQVRLLVIHGGSDAAAAHAGQLQDFLESGGTVLLDQPDPDLFDRLRQALGLDVRMQAYRGVTLKIPAGEGPLYDLLAREDLYWLGTPGPQPYIETGLAGDMVTAVFAPSGDVAAGTLVPVGQGARLRDGVDGDGSGGLSFYAQGRADWTVDLPDSAAGMYMLTVRARGDLAGDEYPRAAIWLDGQAAGFLSVTSTEYAEYGLWFQASAGRHDLGLEFINDYYAPPEDRNLVVAAYGVRAVDASLDVRLYTAPASVVEIPVGNGRLVLNTVRWDAAGSNGLKALRFYASLLTGLGVSWQAGPAPITLQAEAMTPEPGLTNYFRTGTYVYMGSSGTLQGTVSIPTAGRYQIGVLGYGTPAQGQYPILQVYLDGALLGQVELASDSWGHQTLQATLPAGEHRLVLAFVNDFYDPSAGLDRNLWIDLVRLLPIP